MFVSCQMPKTVFFLFFLQKGFVGKIKGKFGLQKKMVNIFENIVFRVIFVKKNMVGTIF